MASFTHMSSPTNVNQPSPTYDPIERFPYEVWEHCFRLAISDAAHGPLPYLAVSTNWNETILHDPAFWTTIIIDDGEDQDARIYTFLYLSQPRLIDVEYRGYDGIPGVMDGCASRIRSIADSSNLYRERPRSLWVFLETWPKAGHLPSYPEMRMLIGENHYTLSRDLLLACPKLNIVSWVAVAMADEPYLSSTVKEVNFTRIDDCGLSNIANRTHIQSLGLICPPWPLLDEHKKGTTAQIVRSSADLRSMVVSLGSQLQSLRMQLSLEFFWEFISVLPHLPQLRSLALDFRYTPTSTRGASIFPFHVQHLKSLRLDFVFAFHANMLGRNSTSNYVNSVLKSFAKEHPLQSLEDLQIIAFYSCDASVLGSLLHSMVNLKSVNLCIQCNNIPDILSTNSMLRLEALTVRPSYLLDYFDPPNLIDLTVDDGVLMPRSFKLGSQIIKLDVPGWIFDVNHTESTSLETFTLKHRYLTLRSSISPGVIGRFSFLEEISFNSGSLSYLDERKGANDFLMKMLRNKGSCPRLHTITFRAIPLWEPLFEVMRRRMNENVQPITRLVFPVIPHVYLLRRLVQLLGGASTVYTTRNVDEIITRRRSCGYFRACTYCFDAGYIKCLYRHSVQSDLPVYEDEMAIQDLLDFDQTSGSVYNENCYIWNDLDAAPEDPEMRQAGAVCSRRFDDLTADITGNELYGVAMASWAF